jgi:hypothetical protein
MMELMAEPASSSSLQSSAKTPAPLMPQPSKDDTLCGSLKPRRCLLGNPDRRNSGRGSDGGDCQGVRESRRLGAFRRLSRVKLPRQLKELSTAMNFLTVRHPTVRPERTIISKDMIRSALLVLGLLAPAFAQEVSQAVNCSQEAA